MPSPISVVPDDHAPVDDALVPYVASTLERYGRDVAEHVADRLYVVAMLGHLEARERIVIVLRFGLLDGHCLSRAEVGQVLGGLSSTRVGSIERDALRRGLERMELHSRAIRWWPWDMTENFAGEDDELVLLSGLQRAHAPRAARLLARAA